VIKYISSKDDSIEIIQSQENSKFKLLTIRVLIIGFLIGGMLSFMPTNGVYDFGKRKVVIGGISCLALILFGCIESKLRKSTYIKHCFILLIACLIVIIV